MKSVMCECINIFVKFIDNFTIFYLQETTFTEQNYERDDKLGHLKNMKPCVVAYTLYDFSSPIFSFGI